MIIQVSIFRNINFPSSCPHWSAATLNVYTKIDNLSSWLVLKQIIPIYAIKRVLKNYLFFRILGGFLIVALALTRFASPKFE